MKTIELSADVMLVNKISFLVSLENNVEFTTIKNVVDWKAATLLKVFTQIKISV